MDEEGVVAPATREYDYRVTDSSATVTSYRIRPAVVPDDHLSSLRELRENWDGYEANPVSPVALSFAQSLIERLQSLPADPQVFPSPEGGVTLQYCNSKGDLEFDIAPTGSVAFIFDDFRTGSQIDGEIMNHPQQLAAALGSLQAGS
jgi:hypothetical protein